MGRYDAGLVDFTALLDTERGVLQARRERQAGGWSVWTRYVALNKVVAVMPDAVVASSP
ncbi:MAG: hypothetical protein ABW067_21020 [Rhizobacter sp.]